jgi:hypothetical protein
MAEIGQEPAEGWAKLKEVAAVQIVGRSKVIVGIRSQYYSKCVRDLQAGFLKSWGCNRRRALPRIAQATHING